MYAYATGGPFGLEDMVTTSGPGLTLLYELFIPLFWCVPVSLVRSEEHTSELQSRGHLVCRLLLEKKKRHDRPLHRAHVGDHGAGGEVRVQRVEQRQIGRGR